MTKAEMLESYLKRFQAYIMCYVDFDAKAFDQYGIIRPEIIQQAVRILFENEVFESIAEMQQDAIKNAQIILPYWCFDMIGEDKK